MAKLLIILVLSTLFISTLTFFVVLGPDEEPEKPSVEKKGPDPVAVLEPKIERLSKVVNKISTDLTRITGTLKLQLNQIDSKVKALDSKVKALAEPVEQEPAENTGDRKFNASGVPADE